MKQTLRLLHLEDNKSDAELILRHLTRDGFVCDVERVETESDFISAVERGCFDLILADYTLPSFNGLTALGIAMEKCPEVPIIFVSGTIREDTAVELIKNGATDYVLKDRLARLGPIVRRAIKEVEEKNERKRTEEALCASERQYRELVDNAIVGVYKSTPEGKFIYVNDAMAQIFECKNTDEMLRLPVWMRYKKPEDREAFLSILREQGKVSYYELEVPTKTGKLKTIVISAVLDEGFITGMVGDITERKEAEEKLRQSERDLEEAQRVAGLGNWILDIVTNTVTWSEELYQIFEVEKTEFGRMYESFMSRVHPDDKQLLLEINRRARENGEPFEIEYRIVTQAGRLKHIREIGYAMRDAGGRVIGLFGTAQDITRNKQVEDRLHETHEKLHHLLAHTPAVIYSLKLDGEKPTPVFVSDNIQRLLGFSVSETLRYEWWLESLHPEDRDRVLAIVGEGIKGQGYSTEYRLLAKDGAYHWIEDNNRVVRDLNGHPVEAVGVMTDITERKHLEAQLLQAQKMEAIGQLAGGIAHDFNNIITAIIGYATIAQMKLPSNDPIRHYMQQMLQSSERAAALTRGLLAFSRKQPLRLEMLGINEVIGRFEKFLIRLLREDIELITHYADEELKVLADRGQIEQVVMNLVTNARDAMPNKGKLSIATMHVVLGDDFVNMHGYGRTGDFAVISVTDTGVGMDEETLQKIFEPFFTTKEVGKGTGLGLATVYGIVKSHDGFINVYSEPGKGASFKIYLPIAHSADDAQVTTGQQPEELQGGTETILLAEDDVDLLTMTSIVLREMGYTVIEAADGNEAVNKFIEYKDAIRLVILDGIMPGKNGKEVYGEITILCPNTRCLFISGYAEDIFTKDVIQQDEVAFLTKPIAPSVLLKKVREVLDR